MNAKHLGTFRAVMRHGSMTHAAHVLRITQPAVSQAITALEADCGFPLFERRNGRVFPTAEAEMLLAEVERLFVDLDRVSRVIEGIRDDRWGDIRIASFPAIGSRLLPYLLSKYCSKRPDVRVTLESRRSRSLIDWVAANQVDIGIGLLPGDHPEVISEQICSLGAMCVLPVGHALASKTVIHARDLAGDKFVSLGREDKARFGVDKVFADLGVARQIQFEAEQSEAACAFVGHGAGVSVVDPFCVFGFQKEIVVRRFEPRIDFTVWCLAPVARRRKKILDEFVEFFRCNLHHAVNSESV